LLRQRAACFEIPHWRIAERLRRKEADVKTPRIPKWILVAEALVVALLLFSLAMSQFLKMLSAASSIDVLGGILLMLALLAIYGVIATRVYHAFVTPANPKGDS
jgi:protein-S-isoprenylcysteine O-methyltransferase Ste14